MKSRTTVSSLVALAALALAPAARAQSFTVIGLPDTQNYSEFFPAIFAQQTQWVVDQRAALDIRYVAHYGDVVNHGDRINEWTNADVAMSTLDLANLPYGVTAGNHDITPSGGAGTSYIPQFFNSYFGPQRFVGRDWYRGASPSGMSSWQTFEAGGVTFIGMHIECDGALRELEWAQGVLDANRDKPVLLTTHRYLQDAEDYTGGVPLVASGRYPDIWYSVEGVYAPDGIRSEEYFDWFIRRNPNIFMVMCGHFHEEYRQTSQNVRGKTVHEVLADYQDDPNGGDGWLRIYRFDLGANRIDVDSYSPYLQQFRTAAESDFALNVQFSDYFETRPTLVLQQGVNGYAGTQDTWINQASPNTSYGQSGVRVSDDDTLNSFFSDSRGQALIRFDDLVGNECSGQIPAGATVVSATLSIQIADDIDTPLFDPDFLVHRVLVPWSESSTWNSLGSGLSGGELSPLLATFSGDNNPDADGLRRIDVTAAVQAWASGAPNYGFAILPEIISGNDDGIEILTSESGNVLLRPRLEVVYQSSTFTYCTAGTTTSGCVPSIAAQGVPSVAATSGFTIRAEQVEGQRAGLIFYGLSGANAQVWQPGSSSFLCVKGPLQRTIATNSGGAAGACDGAIELDWLAYLAAAPLALGEPFSANTVVNAQCWFRDPSAPGTTNLSNALQFTTCP